MPLEKLHEPAVDGSDMVLWLVEPPNGTPIKVRIPRKEMDDFCHPRGISRERAQFPLPLYEAVLDAVDRAIEASKEYPKSVDIGPGDLH